MENMREIKLSNSEKVTIVDDCDYDKFNDVGWSINFHGYAVSKNRDINNNLLFLHREILGISNTDLITDHINHNKLDNRKCNLRICTKLDNNKNVKKKTDRKYSSIYKGVFWCSHTNRWRVNIISNGIRVFVGYYNLEVHGAIAYNEAALRYHGEYACLNEIPDEFKNIKPELSFLSDKSKNAKSSIYIGINKNKNGWISNITINKKKIYIGLFSNEIEAAYARDQIARYFGIKKLNFQNESRDIINVNDILVKNKYE